MYVATMNGYGRGRWRKTLGQDDSDLADFASGSGIDLTDDSGDDSGLLMLSSSENPDVDTQVSDLLNPLSPYPLPASSSQAPLLTAANPAGAVGVEQQDSLSYDTGAGYGVQSATPSTGSLANLFSSIANAFRPSPVATVPSGSTALRPTTGVTASSVTSELESALPVILIIGVIALFASKKR
jgi:hypothetical protein